MPMTNSTSSNALFARLENLQLVQLGIYSSRTAYLLPVCADTLKSTAYCLSAGWYHRNEYLCGYYRPEFKINREFVNVDRIWLSNGILGDKFITSVTGLQNTIINLLLR